jgi:hypothetical protein
VCQDSTGVEWSRPSLHSTPSTVKSDGFVVGRNPSKEGTAVIVQSCSRLVRHHRVTSISGGGACMGIVWLQEVDGVGRRCGWYTVNQARRQQWWKQEADARPRWRQQVMEDDGIGRAWSLVVACCLQWGSRDLASCQALPKLRNYKQPPTFLLDIIVSASFIN